MVVAHVLGPLERAPHDPARVALVGLAARHADVAEHARHRPFLRAIGEDRERLRVGHGDHVRLLDGVEAGDRGAVEAHAPVERVVDLLLGDGEALQLPEDVREPQSDELDVALLHRRHDLVSRHHRLPPRGQACGAASQSAAGPATPRSGMTGRACPRRRPPLLDEEDLRVLREGPEVVGDGALEDVPEAPHLGHRGQDGVAHVHRLLHQALRVVEVRVLQHLDRLGEVVDQAGRLLGERGQAGLLEQQQVAGGGGQDHRRGDVRGRLGLGVHRDDVLLEHDVVARVQLALVEHAVVAEGGDGLVGDQLRQGVGRRAQVEQLALRGLLVPRLGVVVAAEDDRRGLLVGRRDHGRQGLLERLARLLLGAGHRQLQVLAERVDRLGDDRVEHRVRQARRLARPEGAELELVAGEGERAGAVAVARVLGEVRQHRGAQAHQLAGGADARLARDDRVEHLLQLGAEEDRDDRRRGLVGPEAVVLAGARDRRPQQPLVLVDRGDDGGGEEEELQVVGRRVARVEQVVARVGAHRPVVVLARAVDAREGLLVQQADQVVAARHRLHHLHAEQLVVGADVRALEDRRHLVLGRGHLVVAGLDRHAELGQLELHLEHAGQHPLGDGAEVVVVQLVPLRRLGAEERAAGVDQVGTLVEEDLVDQEVLLLGPDGREDAARGVVAEQRERAQRGLAQRLHRAQQRDLRVQRLAGPRRERGRDAEVGAVRVLHDERRARRVPRRVAAGLERRPDAARGEAGRVRLAPDAAPPR